MKKRETEPLWPGMGTKKLKKMQSEVSQQVDIQKNEAAEAIKKRDEEREGKVLFREAQGKKEFDPRQGHYRVKKAPITKFRPHIGA